MEDGLIPAAQVFLEASVEVRTVQFEGVAEEDLGFQPGVLDARGLQGLSGLVQGLGQPHTPYSSSTPARGGSALGGGGRLRPDGP